MHQSCAEYEDNRVVVVIAFFLSIRTCYVIVVRRGKVKKKNAVVGNRRDYL